jgi:hypothetical protein
MIRSRWCLHIVGTRAACGGVQSEVLARQMMAFDLAADGCVLVSDGASITRITAGGASERTLKAELIERVLAL